MLAIRFITEERILMPIIFAFVFYGYNTQIYNFLSSVEVDHTMLLMHIIGVSILSYLLMLVVVFIVLISLNIKLKIIEKSFNFTRYTFFNQLEALTISIDAVDNTNTIEEFNSKFKEVLEDNFRQSNH
jgi:hypothetical protein